MKPDTADQRLVSLDAFRGFTMFWIIGGGSLVAGFQALEENPVINFVVYNSATSRGRGYATTM